jgi:PAS domain S-box-containing protein
VAIRDQPKTDYTAELPVSEVTRQSPVATIVYDAAGRPAYANPAFLELWGLEAAARVPGYTVWSDEQFAGAGLLDAFRQAYAGRSVHVDPFQYDMGAIPGFEGRLLWVQGYLYPLKDRDGNVTHVVAVQEDVTDRWMAAVALKRGEERGRRLQRLTSELAQALTRGEVARVLVRHGGAAVGSRGAVVAVAQDDQIEFIGWTGYAEVQRERWQRLPLDYASPLTDAVRSGTPIWVKDPQELAANWPVYAAESGLQQTRCWAVAPICVPTAGEQRRVLGALGLTFDEIPEQWEETQRFALEIAEVGGRALERAHLYELAEQARTEAVSARREAEEARRRAESANRAKTEFLATMSHELRTPLNAIAGYTELLEMGVQGPINTSQHEALGRIRRSQEHLLGLINSILNLAKIESGQVDYQLASISASTLLAQIEPFVTPLIADKSLVYHWEGCPETLIVHADAEKVVQILLNLVSNAIKFTPSGGAISIHAGEAGDMVTLTVRDTGIGIPAEKLSIVFDRFVQLDTRFTRSAGGTGLGLAISRDLARAMGGDLVAESREGSGSAFTLLLPTAPASDR